MFSNSLIFLVITKSLQNERTQKRKEIDKKKRYFFYHLLGDSSSLSLIVITETAGEGVSWIVMVCCLTKVTCWLSALPLLEWLVACLPPWCECEIECCCQWLLTGEWRRMLLGGVLSFTRFLTGLSCCVSFLWSWRCWGCCGTVRWCWWCFVTLRLFQFWEGCSTSALVLYTSATGNTGRWSWNQQKWSLFISFLSFFHLFFFIMYFIFISSHFFATFRNHQLQKDKKRM